MTALTPPPRSLLSLWAGLPARLAAGQRRRALCRELSTVDGGGLRAVLLDLNLAESPQPTLVDGSGRSRVLLPAMLERVGPDGPALARRLPAVATDLRRVCAGCTVKGRCRRALEAGDSTLRCMTFCPNADTRDALRREERMAA
jgi:hypothetical protein